MSKKYIYLDWNVFKYIKNPRENEFRNLDLAFSALVNKLSKKYCFPFSEGHLSDLLVSYSEKNKVKVDSDLEFIKSISDCLYVKVLEDHVEFHDVNPCSGFYKYKKEIEVINNKDISLSVSGESFGVDIKELDENELLGNFIKENNGTLDAATYKKFITNVSENIDKPEYYKQFRSEIINLKETFSKRDTILDQGSNFFAKISPLLDFMIETDEAKIRNDLYNAGCCLSFINGEEFADKSLPEKVRILYHALDFNFYLKEKINKKNKPSNIDRDCLNLIHALHARYYITEDKATKLKSQIVLCALSHKLKVLGMQELLYKFD